MNNKMPLVVFNFYDSDPADLTRTLVVPREAMDAKWKLISVKGMYMSDNKDEFSYMELEIPELMNTETVLYASKSEGNVPLPNRGFRFYNRTAQLSEYDRSLVFDGGRDGARRFVSVFGIVSEELNWDLGRVKLETPVITCKARGKKPNASAPSPLVSLQGVSVILSYE